MKQLIEALYEEATRYADTDSTNELLLLAAEKLEEVQPYMKHQLDCPMWMVPACMRGDRRCECGLENAILTPRLVEANVH